MQTVRKRKRIQPVLPRSMMDGLVGDLAGVLGSDRVHRASESDQGEPRMFIDSGVPELNYVLDRKGRGWPVGRIIEVYGGEATCKTGIGYELIRQVQRMGGDALLYPSEGNYDEWLAKQYKIDLDKLIIADNETVEGIFTSYNRAINRVGRLGLLVGMIDSVAGMATQAELDDLDEGKEIKRDRSAQVRALMISSSLRKLGARIPRTNSILFLVNQLRDNPDAGMFAKKSKPPGGRAIKFYASVRLELTIIGKYKRTYRGKRYVAGVHLKIMAEKNRLARPYQEAEILLDFNKGLLPKPKKRKAK